MAAASTHFKLGLFTLLVLVAVFATAFGLGIRGVKKDTVNYHTYFDESVQGLDIGAPVKFRGVNIGSASQIQMAPDRKLVDVTLAINRVDAASLRLAERKVELRAQLGTQGITGVKLIDIDFVDPKTSPGPALSFTPDENYIPAKPSFLGGLQDQVAVVADRLPHVIDATESALRKAEVILDDLGQARVPEHLTRALDTITGSAGQLGLLAQHVDRARIPDKTAAALERLNTTIAAVNGLVEGIGGDGGLLASTRRATDSIGDLGHSTSSSMADLERTMRDLDEAAIAIRELAEAVDRDPDMLLKGRSRSRQR